MGGSFQATRDISVSITDDTVDEPDEDFTITLSYSNPSLPHLQGGPDTATVTIADNDHVPVTLGWEETAFTAEEPTSPGTTTSVTLGAMAVTATDKRPESGFTFDFTVNTVDGSARQPNDYEQLTATETFDRNDFFQRTVNGQPRWVASADFTVNVEHDTVDEPLERFTVRLAFIGSRQPHLTLGDSTATVTTTDDVASLADLRTTVRASAGTVERGEQLTYDWSVSNSGPAASTNTVLAGTLDAGTSFVSAQVASPATGQCRRSGQTVTCTFGTLELGNTTSGEIVVEVKDNASADIGFTAIARADQLDRRPGDNDDSVTTELVAAPRQITNLRASGASAHIDVRWSTPGDNGSPITRYELERKEAGESYALVTPGPSVTATTHRDSQVSAGTTYTYQLRAFNADGDAEWSNEATATARTTPPPPPPPPRGGGGGGGGGGAPANRAPEFMEGDRTTRSVAENTPAGANIGEPVAASDFNRDTLTYSLRGLGSDLFDLDASSGQLLTKDALDYETESSYIVFVWVQDNKNANGRADTQRDTVIRIELTVTNEDEAGAVALSLSEPDVDIPITAALTDPDGGLDRVVWSWARSADQTAWTAIRGAAAASYTPVATDKGSYLRATASYTDGHGPRKSARAATAASVPSNAAPVFNVRDLDTGRGLNGAIERSVAENTGEGEGVGAPVAATDAEDGGALTYALGGADAALFTIDEGTGQIRVGAATALDYEADKNVYEVTVTATDSLGLSTTVAVTIAVTNVGVGSPSGDTYDADGNEAIDRDEVLAAVADYFADRITQEEAIAVIQLYFAG